ncbi:MAG: SPOR domain-containing protein [Gammaproteobacteria bacterium]
MKVFFILLLIVNIAFGLVQWLVPYEQLVAKNNSAIPVAEELRLLDEPVESDSPSTSGINSQNQMGELQVSEAIIDNQLCITIGPFKDKTRALEVSGRYSAKNIKGELRSSLEKEYLGIMVYIASHKNRQAAVKTAEALAKKGIRDYLIINEPGRPYALSLGVFGLKKNADRLIAKLKQLKYPVQSEPRYRNRTIFWLYYQHSTENPIDSMLDAEDIENGINQIQRQCT